MTNNNHYSWSFRSECGYLVSRWSSVRWLPWRIGFLWPSERSHSSAAGIGWCGSWGQRDSRAPQSRSDWRRCTWSWSAPVKGWTGFNMFRWAYHLTGWFVGQLLYESYEQLWSDFTAKLKGKHILYFAWTKENKAI